MSHLLEEIFSVGETICTGDELNLTIPEKFQGVFFCDTTKSDSVQVQMLAAVMFISLMATAVIGNTVVMWIIFKHKGPSEDISVFN
uniref:G_PROTEIN_RECEP_F1_2 domain-containing protein n=1 Tax=Heterorhabditis bacteriophora TaxID=37862 RepID=A0A1I7XRX0_HETBA